MSARERDRLKVLHEVRKRHITQKQAGGELGISVRWVRTLVKRLRREGDSALRHRLRGRPSKGIAGCPEAGSWSGRSGSYHTRQAFSGTMG